MVRISKFISLVLLWTCSTNVYCEETQRDTTKGLAINELMTKNVSYELTLLDNVYSFPGWVELHNNGVDTIDLKGYRFVDHENNSWTCNSSFFVFPDSFFVFWFSELNKSNHTSFKLDPEGGHLTLYDRDSVVVDEISYPSGIRNISFGYNSYEDAFGHLNCPTIGKSNKSSLGFYQKVGVPQFDIPSGFYENPFSLVITSDTLCDIYYTTDGSEPVASKSFLYTDPIKVEKNIVVRAIAVRKILQNESDRIQYEVVSEPATASYFVSERDIKLPVVSLVTDSCYFYDKAIGIYNAGDGRYTPKYSGWTKLSNANYWGDEKRPTYIELFEKDKKLCVSREVDFSIFGGYSRSYDKKSLKLNPSKKYGDSQFKYAIFPSKPSLKWKSILLRSSGQDYCKSFMRDGFMHTLLESVDVDIQAYYPVAVFVNGSYFGLMNLRERHNEDFVYSNYGVDTDSVVMTNSLMEKSWLKKIKSEANADSIYVKISRFVDVNEISNFIVAQNYFANTDWGGNNFTFWSRSENGLWRTILYDVDEGFSCSGNNTNLNTISYGYKNPTIKYLLSNDRFLKMTLSKNIVHLGTTFEPQQVIGVLDSLSSIIKDEALYYMTYRKSKNLPNSDWENQIKKMREFALSRPKNVFSHLKEYYSLGDTASIKIISKTEGVEFLFNDEIILTSNFSSKCFENFKITLCPIVPDGYLFDHWKVTKTDTSYIVYDTELKEFFHTATTYEVILKEDSALKSENLNLFINELCITNKMYVDESRDADDWIELYNASSKPVDIGGMYISDARNNLTKWQIPNDSPEKTTIPPKRYLMLWADSEPQEGPLHTDFSLSASKRQTVSISRMIDDTIQVIDSVRYELHQKGESYARFSYDDFGSWTKTKWLTFNSPNRLYGYEMTCPVIDSIVVDSPNNIVKDTSDVTTFIADYMGPNPNVFSYPNPAIDEIHFVTPWTEKTLLRIYKEERLYLVKYIQSGTTVDLSSISSGVYIAKLRNVRSSEEYALRFIKK